MLPFNICIDWNVLENKAYKQKDDSVNKISEN